MPNRLLRIVLLGSLVVVSGALLLAPSDPAGAGEKASPALATLSAPAPPGCGGAAEVPRNVFEAMEKANACSADSLEFLAPETSARPPRRGYCQCGCGIGCTSSADCGGDPCRLFITCC